MSRCGTYRERFREAQLQPESAQGETLRELIGRKRPATLDSDCAHRRREGERFQDGRRAAFLPIFSVQKASR